MSISVVEQRLRSKGLQLPEIPTPAGGYDLWSRLGQSLDISGQVAVVNGAIVTGKVGDGINTEAAAQLAANCTLRALTIARDAVTTLDELSVHNLRVFVASTSGFEEQHLVANGASEILRTAFGIDSGHARTSIGVSSLPMGAPVEVDITFEIRELATCAIHK